MASISIKLRGKKNPSPLYVRFVNGRTIDITSKLHILINPKHWDKKKEKLRNLIEIENKDEMNTRIEMISAQILKNYNNDFMLGETIDKDWLDNTIAKIFNRPMKQGKLTTKNEFIYYTQFSKWWIEEKSSTYKIGKNKFLSDRVIGQYKGFIDKFEAFESHTKKKIKIKEIDADKINDFIAFLEDEGNFGEEYVKRLVSRLKFFLARAEEENLPVNKNYKQKIFIEKKEEVLDPYLNEREINLIFDYDFSSNETLDNVRDNFIIGLWTGLRISDFNNNLDIDNIDNDMITIRTEKTDTWVNIPLHPHVKYVLNKRLGMLPPRLSDQKFNQHIKTICEEVGINQLMRGYLFTTAKDENGKNIRRKKLGLYEKHKLVSSHICRRSFATNLFGIVPNNTILAAGGWATEKMMLRYVKKTKQEHVEVLKKLWEKKNKETIKNAQ